MSIRFDGIGASPGVAIGRAHIVVSRRGKVHLVPVHRNAVEDEIGRFRRALAATRADLERIRVRAAEMVGPEYAGIIDSHILLLHDPDVIQATEERIRKKRQNAAFAYVKVTQALIRNFESLEDPYFKERSADILDVRERVLRHLLGMKSGEGELGGPVIVVAERLTPSFMLPLPKDLVLGFATQHGGRGSHAALLARSMELPMVCAGRGLLEALSPGQTMVVDGYAGTVIVDPTTEELEKYEQKRERVRAFFQELETLRDLPACTADGHVVELSANIDYPEEVDAVASHGGQGIGLYRSEFLLMTARGERFPDEATQYRAYYHVAQRMYPENVIIRTFDVGGDKLGPEDSLPGDNPFLGYRAIRLCLGRPELFRVQLRALLRATALGNIKIMFPMISGLGELLAAKEMLESVKEELRREEVPFEEEVPVGIMIEVPSAAITADLLAPHVDFFSVGTNDLTQYTLAVDRTNELVDYLYEPFHPAVLRLLERTVEAARAHGVRVGICGEMASDPLATLVLLGLGFDELSTNLMILPEIKKIIRSVTLAEARRVATEALTHTSTENVRAYLADVVAERLPWLEI